MTKGEDCREILKGLRLEQEIISARIRKIVADLVEERNSLRAKLELKEQSILCLNREVKALKAKVDCLENLDSSIFEGRFLD